MPEMPDLASLTHEQKDQSILALYQRVVALGARVLELETRLATDSHSSFEQTPVLGRLLEEASVLRRSSGRKAGGQPEHEGSTLRKVAEPDVTVIHPLPAVCDACGAALPVEAAKLTEERRQVVDLPALHFEVTEHRGSRCNVAAASGT